MTAAIDLSWAPNPDWAAEGLERLSDVALPADPAEQRRLAVVLGSSPALADLLAARPALLDVVTDPALPAWTATDVLERAMGADRADGWLAALQREGVLRIAVRDLTGLASTAAAAFELSDLADGLLTAALQIAHEAPEAGDAQLAVFGMGKLGGQELNYVSDVDVLFAHEGQSEAAERLARSFLQLTGGHTAQGAVYEMDANLRPEGRNGPLTRTIESYRSYYERWAKTWEFQALLKLRPIAGPAGLTEAFTSLIDPFVWPESLGGEAVEEIQAMKSRVERSKPVLKDGERQLKLAPGGLRDIEFAVQLLQMVHGPADPLLRVRGTLPGLAELARGGYVDDGDANLFSDSYIFLRTVEHRLQLRHLRRTHTLPDDDEEMHHLARATGFRDLPTRTAQAEFASELSRVRISVRRLHEQLFYRPLLATIASWGEEHRVATGSRLDVDAVTTRLRALGFDRPGQAVRHLETLVRGSDRTARQLRVILPGMLEALAETPDPDAGLAALREMVDELRHNPRFVRTIRDNPAVAGLLARVLGRSPRLASWFTRQPEVLRLLDEPDALTRARTREELHAGAAGLVRRGGGRTSADALRRYKRREALRTALRSALDEADVVQVGHELTWLSEGLLQAAVQTVLEHTDGVRLAVVALGRFGAAELAHSSDLDVLFVHEVDEDVDGAAAETAAAEVVELMSSITPEGAAFRIDTKLRPEGRSGPLSRTLESHRAYYSRWADHWELLAMTQARPAAGDQELGQAFIDMVHPLVYTDPVDTARLVAVRKMKARLEVERAGTQTRRGPRPRLRPGARPRSDVRSSSAQRRSLPHDPTREDLKLGPGGLSDVEWTVQLLALVHGAAHPAVRGPGTLDGLAALRDIDALSAEEEVWLASGWRLLSHLRNVLYLVGERDTSTLPSDPMARARLAAAVHLESSQMLAEEVDRARRRIRKVFDRRFFAG